MPLMPGSSVTGTVKTACAPQPAAAYNPRSVPETGGESAAGNPEPKQINLEWLFGNKWHPQLN